MTTIEAIDLVISKSLIEMLLNLYGPTLKVTASQQSEDGYTLILEGDPVEMSEFIYMANRVNNLYLPYEVYTQ